MSKWGWMLVGLMVGLAAYQLFVWLWLVPRLRAMRQMADAILADALEIQRDLGSTETALAALQSSIRGSISAGVRPPGQRFRLDS